jgi:hypothetical protein
MNLKLWSTAALTLALGSPAAGQQPTREATDMFTAVGCVQGESQYRAEIADGKGGVAGSGVGASNEYVLRAARSVSIETLKPRGTSGDQGYEVVYSLTGNLEHEVAPSLGKQIAVSGYVEVDDTAGTNRVKDLPRLNVIGWHKVSDRCPARTAARK